MRSIMRNMADHKTLSTNVRSLREARGWTQQEASARLGISRRLLVQIETGTANPSLTTLLGIANGFAVELMDLLAEGEARPAHQIQHDNASAPTLWSTSAGSAARLLVGMGPLEVWSWTLADGDVRQSAAHRPGSMEAAIVRTGQLEVLVDDTEILLATGQSAMFAADHPHRYRNPSDVECRFDLIVFDPASH